jgi:hypothetical protein
VVHVEAVAVVRSKNCAGVAAADPLKDMPYSTTRIFPPEGTPSWMATDAAELPYDCPARIVVDADSTPTLKHRK